MGFSFGFTEDELEGQAPPKVEDVNPLDTVEIGEPAKIVTLEDLLQSLIGTRITYEPVTLKSGETLYKRELFDVKQQLMMEDDFKDRSNEDLFEILIGDTYEDLKKGVYEGGLKSWECSYDMIDKLGRMDLSVLESGFNCVELGCGTSLPSLYILSKLFKQKSGSSTPAKFVLADYNHDVLRLVSLPNVLANWCEEALDPKELAELQTKEGQETVVRPGEILVTQRLAEAFTEWLASRHISVTFISGSWGRPFVGLVHEIVPDLADERNLVLTSETIYSTRMLPVVAQMVLELTYGAEPLTIVSAKDLYFGVGGSVSAFLEYLASHGSGYQWQVEKVDSPLKRSVVSISRVI